MERIDWNSVQGLPSRSFTCGHCGNPLASEKGWYGQRPQAASVRSHIYICHHCSRPTFFSNNGAQSPGVVFGHAVQDISEESVRLLYDEARKATGAGSYTAAVLCCRKLLMHVAVAKGAAAGESFLSYVQYLADHHYVPPDAKDWVDHIRQKGNEANHEITIMSTADAEELVAFCEMLLKLVFEFPATIKKKSASGNAAT